MSPREEFAKKFAKAFRKHKNKLIVVESGGCCSQPKQNIIMNDMVMLRHILEELGYTTDEAMEIIWCER